MSPRIDPEWIAAEPEPVDDGGVADFILGYGRKGGSGSAKQGKAGNPEDEGPALLDVVHAEDYASELPPKHDPIVAELFDTGDKCLLVGSSKARKSFATLQLAVAVATGDGRSLGLDIPKPRRVLALQLENKGEHSHRRLWRMARALGVKHGALEGWLYLVNGRGQRITIERIIATAKHHAVDLVVVDPIYKLIAGDENSSEVVANLLAGFDRIATEAGAAVLYVHHERKGASGDRQAVDRGSGSGLLARDYDAAIYLSHHASADGCVVVSTIARNYAPRPAWTLQFTDAGAFECSDEAPIEETTASRRKATSNRQPISDDSILRIVATDGPFAVERLRRRLQDAGLTRELAKEAPRRLVSEGLLDQYREKRFGGCTWVGTKSQIEAKCGQTDQTDRAESPDGMADGMENGGKAQ